ncbi:MAG: hypothetical protein WCS99_18380 [Limisphaerales bacterium]
MNGSAQEIPPWSRQRWGGAVLIVFALHLAALFLVSSRQEKIQGQPQPPATVHWLTSADSSLRTLDSLLLNDPTLLAVASQHGFSGAAWLRPQSPEYRVSEWADTAGHHLAQPTKSLGVAFQQIVSGTNPSIFDPALKPAVPAPPMAVAQPALRTASRLRIEGAVSSRKLVEQPALRSWPFDDVLADSRIQILASDEGIVFSPRLVSNGTAKSVMQRTADQHALALSRSLRFESSGKSGGNRPPSLTEGTLVFQWHTAEAPALPAK